MCLHKCIHCAGGIKIKPTTNNNPCSGMNDHPRRDTDLSYTRIETSGSCLQFYMGFMIFEGPNTRLYRFKGQHKGVQIFKFWVFQGLTQ